MKRSVPDGVNCVLVTGGAGYLGSSVVSQLLERGLKVRVLDSLLFGEDSFKALRSHADCELIRGDVRDVEVVVRTITGCDTVIHLAGIVGDHACDENQQLAQEVNRAATRMLADVAPRCGVRRFLFASSCSVYGSSAARVDESSPVRPLSLYAQTKIDSEQILLSSRGSDFAPTILRLGTLFGLSARMRFDLVVNLLLSRAISTGRININNGWQWRPFVHVRDAARAFLACLAMPSDVVAGEVFNVGSNFLNLQIKDVGNAVARLVPGMAVQAVYNKIDRRSYRVSFDKIERTLGFVCTERLEEGMSEVVAAIRSGEVIDLAIPPFASQPMLLSVKGAAESEAQPLRRLAVVARARKESAIGASASEKTFKAVSAGRA
jgi:nucleoside-diphosphate-sugar epimerase